MAYFLDALRNEASLGSWRYYANDFDGQPVTIRYAFMTSVPAGAYTGNGDPRPTFESLSSAERDRVEAAMDKIEAVCGVTFQQVSQPDDPDLLIGSFDISGNVAGYANHITPFFSGELMLDRYTGVNSMSVILHELGHSLGLEHPFEGALTLPSAEDLKANTIMSYDWSTDPGALGIYDVIALQSIYGPAARRRGDDSYQLGQDKLIWDGGGRDVIDASDASQGVTLRLEGGSWSHIGPKTASFLAWGQVWLGHFTKIEEAIGSRFSDTLLGNGFQNVIEGGRGNDRIEGRAGDDTHFGDFGNDRIDGGTGADWISGGPDNDRLIGGSGADNLAGGTGADRLLGGDGADRFVFRLRNDSGLGADRDVIERLGGQDKIVLSQLNLTFRNHQDFSGAGNELRVARLGSEAILQVDFDGDRTADFAVRVLGVTDVERDQLIL